MEIKKIAIAVSTRGREETLCHSLSQWKIHYPNAHIIVVEDNDSIPLGIAKTKNKCLEALREYGAQHNFLADDDVYPIDSLGLLRYANSGFNHMCMSFDHTSNGKRISNDVFINLKNEDWVSYNSPCGCLLYVNNTVLNSGINFDENYGIWGMEHKDYSLQIHKSGFTEFPFLDISNSINHFYSHDYHMTVISSVPENVRVEEIKKNIRYFENKFVN